VVHGPEEDEVVVHGPEEEVVEGPVDDKVVVVDGPEEEVGGSEAVVKITLTWNSWVFLCIHS